LPFRWDPRLLLLLGCSGLLGSKVACKVLRKRVGTAHEPHQANQQSTPAPAGTQAPTEPTVIDVHRAHFTVLLAMDVTTQGTCHQQPKSALKLG
jgi:hypothetical protein